MRRKVILAGVLLTAGLSAAPAQAGYKADVRSSAKELYRAVDRQVGRGSGGRNIARDGVRTRAGRERPATLRELLHFRAVLSRMLAPPASAVRATVASSPTAAPALNAPASTSSSTTAGLPACASESGSNYSTGPANTNPSSGATGRYQELPMHRQRGGLCEGLDLSPGGQDKCAARIYAAQGAGAWVGCGG